MTRVARLLAWLEGASDRLSPIVVKEVRQAVRGRELMYSFGASLVAGLTVAFFGASYAMAGSAGAGSGAFSALMACLAILGFAVVPLAAFSTLRAERIEQTLELMTLTALTPRRVVVGKLLAQGVKLGTLFAGLAPFVAMSFLLGGIDFATIVIALGLLFMWSLWACGVGLFLSSLLKSRAMVGLVFVGGGVVLLFVLGIGRMLIMVAARGAAGLGAGSFFFAVGPGGGSSWWAFAFMATFWLATLVNLVLLAENRLSQPKQSGIMPLRVGFLSQFLLMIGWALMFIAEPLRAREGAIGTLAVAAGVHLWLVAMFTVTEELSGRRRSRTPARERAILAILRPGGSRGAVYILAQMALLVATVAALRPDGLMLRWLLAVCAYICFFTGVPAAVYRAFRPAHPATLRQRVVVLMLLPLLMSLVLPDLVYYLLWRPDSPSMAYATRHLINPFRTLVNWADVETNGWTAVPYALGVAGLLGYLALIHLARSLAAAATPAGSRAEAGEAGRADALY